MTDYLDIELAWGGFYACVSHDCDGISIMRMLDFNRDAYHAALFNERFDDIPEPGVVDTLSPFVGHVPVDAKALLRNQRMVLVGRQPLTPADLAGYMLYREQTHMPEDERNELTNTLIRFGTDDPLSLRLSILNGELQVEERK